MRTYLVLHYWMFPCLCTCTLCYACARVLAGWGKTDILEAMSSLLLLSYVCSFSVFACFCSKLCIYISLSLSLDYLYVYVYVYIYIVMYICCYIYIHTWLWRRRSEGPLWKYLRPFVPTSNLEMKPARSQDRKKCLRCYKGCPK